MSLGDLDLVDLHPGQHLTMARATTKGLATAKFLYDQFRAGLDCHDLGRYLSAAERGLAELQAGAITVGHDAIERQRVARRYVAAVVDLQLLPFDDFILTAARGDNGVHGSFSYLASTNALRDTALRDTAQRPRR